MGDIKEKIQIARDRIDEDRVQLAILDLRYAKRMIQREMVSGKYSSVEEAIEVLNKKYRDIIFNNFGVGLRNGQLRKTPDANTSDYFALITARYLIKHPEEILDQMDKGDKSEMVEGTFARAYSYDMRNNVKELVNNAFCNYYSQVPESEKSKFVEGKISIKQRGLLQKTILDLIKQYQDILENNIRDAPVRRVTQMATILDENGSLEKGIDMHNRRLRMMGLKDLQVSSNTKGGNKPQVRSMSDWKKPGIVNKLPLDTLIASSAFFTNRLCKEYITYKRAIFILKELGIVDELASTADIEVDLDVVKEVLGKYQFLQGEARDDYSARGITEYSEEDAEEYKKEYDQLLPESQNDIVEDKKRFAIEDETLEEMYQKKNQAMDTLIISLLSKKANINWGYIPEVHNGRNSIQTGKRMIQLGFDLEGFNMPIRLHHGLENMRECIKGYTGKDEIPLYQGNEDWTVKDQVGQTIRLTTQVFLPTRKEDRKKIKQMAESVKEEDRVYNFLTHLNWMANRVTPARFTRSKVVSLDSGEITDASEISLDD